MAERPMPRPKNPDPALPNEAGRLPGSQRSEDEVPWKALAENLGKELTIERNWRMRLQEELWRLDPSKDPRLLISHEHVYRCQDCGEIGRGPDRDWDAEPTLYDPDTGVHEGMKDWIRSDSGQGPIRRASRCL